jgi:hypothetical protein
MSFIEPLRVHQTARLRQIQAVTWAGGGLYRQARVKNSCFAKKSAIVFKQTKLYGK